MWYCHLYNYELITKEFQFYKNVNSVDGNINTNIDPDLNFHNDNYSKEKVIIFDHS